MADDAKTGQPIFGRYSVGLQNVGSYQVSGWPWVSGSAIGNNTEVKVEFPMITRRITVIASGTLAADDDNALRLHFAPTGSNNVEGGHHYVTLDAHGASISLDTKCKEIYFTAKGSGIGYEVVAELTNIPTSRMFDLTGSGVTL